MQKCTYCSSENIIENVLISQEGTYNDIGPVFKDGLLSKFAIKMYADICKDCGSIIRFHVDPKMLTEKLITKKKE